jgi:hypothetical protein
MLFCHVGTQVENKMAANRTNYSTLTKEFQISSEAFSEYFDSPPKLFNARLQLYMRCVSMVIDIRNDQDVKIIMEKDELSELTNFDIDQLLLLCATYSPDNFLDKCFFKDDSKCGVNMNEFYSEDQVRDFNVPDNIIINGDSKRVLGIMCFKQRFLQEHFHQPMNFYRNRIRELQGKKGVLEQDEIKTCCVMN